ncbi:MAG: hypothetical protein HQK83_13470 [Fibrobacteria bacterium]|nr:hypothetical protein [Fibrobacteria bacterium]
MRLVVISLFCLFLQQLGLAKDIRSRSESIFGMFATNTVGLGNIFISGGFQTYFQTSVIAPEVIDSLVHSSLTDELHNLVGNDDSFSKRDYYLTPYVNAVVGLTSFMHLEVSSIPWNGQKIGVTSAVLKMTLPGNDNLRVIGFAGTANVTLSTEENVVNSQKETPSFDPVISFSVLADADLIKWYPAFPAKLYLNYANFDDVRFHNYYNQHKVSVGFEYKGEKESYYLKSGLAVYLEKSEELSATVNLDGSTGITHFGGGYRKRFVGIHPFTINVDFEFDLLSPFGFLDDVLHKSPLLSFNIQTPVFYKETNTEALRSLMYAEQARKRIAAAPATIKLKRRKASDLTLDMLMIKNINRDFLEDDQLDAIFLKEDKEQKIKQRQKIFRELNSN